MADFKLKLYILFLERIETIYELFKYFVHAILYFHLIFHFSNCKHFNFILFAIIHHYYFI